MATGTNSTMAMTKKNRLRCETAAAVASAVMLAIDFDMSNFLRRYRRTPDTPR
jgi:hypothetical protein